MYAHRLVINKRYEHTKRLIAISNKNLTIEFPVTQEITILI